MSRRSSRSRESSPESSAPCTRRTPSSNSATNGGEPVRPATADSISGLADTRSGSEGRMTRSVISRLEHGPHVGVGERGGRAVGEVALGQQLVADVAGHHGRHDQHRRDEEQDAGERPPGPSRDPYRIPISELVADHEAVGARLAVAARDGDVAAEQRGLHAPVEVAHRGALEQDRVLDLGALDHAVARRRRCRGRRRRRARRAPAPMIAGPAHGRALEPRAGLDDHAAVDLRVDQLAVDPRARACRGSAGWPRACRRGARCPSTSRARRAARRAGRRRRATGSRR